MTPLIDLAIRSSVLVAIGLLLSMCLAKRSAALRHRVLASSLLGAVLVVPFSLTVPALRVPLPHRLVDPGSGHAPALRDLVIEYGKQPLAAQGTVDRGRGISNLEPSGALSGTLLLVLGWLAGAVAIAIALISSLLRVGRVARRGRRIEDASWLAILGDISKRHGATRSVVITRTDATDMLGTWGFLRPEVLVPRGSENWTGARVHVVLSHELAHIRRHDWFVQISAEIVRAILWFNPLVWIACQRLRRESEQACDDEVLGSGVGAREYAAHLLELTRQCRRSASTWASAIPIAHPSTLETRIKAMLNPLVDRRLPSTRTLASLAAALVLITLPVAAVRARQASPMPLLGTIYDATGAVIPGVQVVLIDATDTKWTATSKASGRFELPPVGAGKYLLDVSLPGFRALRQEFELRDPRDWNRAVTLQIGALTETVSISGTRATAPPQLISPSAPSQRIRVGGSIRVPQKQQHVAPVYPASMLAAGLSGVVPVEAIIAQDGTVSSVRVLSAQVHPDFAIAAVDAVRQWRFTPTLLNKVPVEVAMTVTVRFELAD